jgi:hypothetical protein
MGDGLDPADIGALFRRFLEEVVERAPHADGPFVTVLREHLGGDPSVLPIVSERFQPPELPNVQLALDAYLAEDGRSAELVGITMPHKRGMAFSLGDLLASGSSSWAPRPGPVDYLDVALGDERVLTCVQLGLFLVRDGTRRAALLVSAPPEHGQPQVVVEVLAEKDHGSAVLADLRRLMRERNVYRGRVVSLLYDMYGGLALKHHEIPKVARDDIVLPEGILERIERHTIGFVRQQEKLRAAGRHLKRGLLLHGPPGVGKTLSVMYLANEMPERTVLLLTGQGLGALGPLCAMARALQPSTVVLEDVDLVAEERTLPGVGHNPLLFELLNEMDGLGEDADVMFVLTTNRVELLEPALAERPGRIDQAVELGLPDAVCRRRLLELYGRGLTMNVADLEKVVERTNGVSAAFVRELLRRAALLSAEEADDIVVEDRHLDAALAELRDGGMLTRTLLGFRP